MEADDVISYVANKGDFNRCTIMSTDKDFLQLVSDKINVWSPSKKKVYNPETLMEEYNVHPENFMMTKHIAWCVLQVQEYTGNLHACIILCATYLL